MGWIDQVRSVGVLEIAKALKLPFRPSPPPGSLPCPFCGAIKRGESDRRLSAGVTRDGLGFRCHRCNGCGDAGTLLAVAIEGTSQPASWWEVRSYARNRGWCDEVPPSRSGTSPLADASTPEHATHSPIPIEEEPPTGHRQTIDRQQQANNRSSSSALQPKPSDVLTKTWESTELPGDLGPRSDLRGKCSPRGRLASAPSAGGIDRSALLRPPADEVATLWAGAVPVLDDAEVSDWLRRRGLDPEDVELHDLVRALPPKTKVPTWARRDRAPWPRSPDGFKVLTPLWDPQGRFSSLHARAITPRDPSKKATNPIGYQTSGLVMANSLGIGVLRRTREALDLVRKNTRDLQQPGLVLCEGLPDFLSAATEASDADEMSPAVWGFVEGSWSEDLAAQVPDGIDVVVVVQRDPNGKGNAYWERIRGSLKAKTDAGRVFLRRYDPQNGVSDE